MRRHWNSRQTALTLTLDKTESLISSAAQPCLAAHCPQNLLVSKLPALQVSALFKCFILFMNIYKGQSFKSFGNCWKKCEELRSRLRLKWRRKTKKSQRAYFTLCACWWFLPSTDSSNAARHVLYVSFMQETNVYLCHMCGEDAPALCI